MLYMQLSHAITNKLIVVSDGCIYITLPYWYTEWDGTHKKLVIISICLTVHLFGLDEIQGGGQYGYTMAACSLSP
jgi:hypothetical protein